MRMSLIKFSGIFSFTQPGIYYLDYTKIGKSSQQVIVRFGNNELSLVKHFKYNQSINHKTNISEERPHQIIFKIVFY